MKKEIAEQWIEALRSGNYTQGTRKLCTVDADSGKEYYCCLGVLCDILKTPYKNNDGAKEFDGEIGRLPKSVIEKTGIRSVYGLIDLLSLAYLNDCEQKSFKEISEVIETNWEKL